MSMITTILTPIITGVSVSLIVFFVTRYYAAIHAKKEAEIERKETERAETAKKNSEKIDALTKLCCATAQHKIITISNEYIRHGNVTSREKQILMDIYEPYHQLGWNNYAEAAVAEVEKLPVTAETT